MDAQPQDQAHVSELAAFARVPFVVESAAGAPRGLFFDAARAMAGVSAVRVKVPAAGAGDPAWPPVDYVAAEPLAGEVIGEDDHREILRHVRGRVEAEAPRVAGFAVEILDRKEASPGENALVAMGRTDPFARTFASYVKDKRDALPFTMFVRVKDGRTTCVVTATPTRSTMRDFTGSVYAGKANFGAATARDFHLWVNWHEVGHCLLGASEPRADAFGLLMLVREGGSRDMVDSVHAFREGVEMMSPNLSDVYFVSDVSGWVSRMYDRLRADKDFMAMDVAGVAAMASAVSDRLAPGQAQREDRMAVRRAMDAGARKAVHWLRSDAGMASVSYMKWLESRAGDSPVFARVLDVLGRLRNGPSTASRYVLDRKGFEAELGRVARGGDPTAKSMALALREPHPKAQVLDWRGPIDFDSKPSMAGKFFALEGDADVVFSESQDEFIVREAGAASPSVAANLASGAAATPGVSGGGPARPR